MKCAADFISPENLIIHEHLSSDCIALIRYEYVPVGHEYALWAFSFVNMPSSKLLWSGDSSIAGFVAFKNFMEGNLKKDSQFQASKTWNHQDGVS
jgi:hypothetical protein